MYKHLYKMDFDVRSEFSKKRLEEEKEFARACFEAGQRFGTDLTMSIEDGMPTKRPDFDEFYKQFEK